MKMIDKFIIRPLNDTRFINTKEVNGKTMIINTSIEKAKDVNRIAEVIELPMDYDGNVRVGDHIVVHHNVFRDYFDGSGKTRESDHHIKDGFFYVQQELVYLILRGEQRIAVDNYCFIEPIITDKKWVGKVEEEHIGIVKYSNKGLEKLGVRVGDKIVFHTNCEYLFEIDGLRLYRMRTHRILVKLN